MTFRADFGTAGLFREWPCVHSRATRSARDTWGAALAWLVSGRGRAPITPRPRRFNRANLLPSGRHPSSGMTRFAWLAPAVIAAALAATSAGAGELPSAEEVFQRHVAAIGGVAALSKPHNMVFKGEADLVPLKTKAPIEFYVEAPDRFLFRLKYHYAFFGMIRVPFVGVRQPECGYDGTNGWTIDFDRRLEPMSTPEAVSFRTLCDKFSPLYASRHFILTRTMDVERFANRDCYRVLVVLPSGDHAFEYYDTAGGLLVGTDYPFFDSGAWFNVRMTWSDYRRLRSGLRVPLLGGHREPLATTTTCEAKRRGLTTLIVSSRPQSALRSRLPHPAWSRNQSRLNRSSSATWRLWGAGKPFAATPRCISPANFGSRATKASPARSRSIRPGPIASFSKSSFLRASTGRDVTASAIGGRRARK